MEAGALVKVVHSLGKLCIFMSIGFHPIYFEQHYMYSQNKILNSYLSIAVEMSPFKINVSFIFVYF